MRRRLFDAAALLSLLLSVGAGGMWVRSYYAFDSVNVTAAGRSLSLATPAGRVWVVYDVKAPLYTIEPGRPEPMVGIDTLATNWTGAEQYAGFTWVLTKTLIAAVVPFWALVLLTLVVPALCLWRRRRRPRHAGGGGFPIGPSTESFGAPPASS